MAATHPTIEETKYHISTDAIIIDEQNKVLNHFNTFGLFDQLGNIYPAGKMVRGIYHDGTRFLSRLVMTIDGKKPLLLSNAIKEDNEILSVDLTNPVLAKGNVPENTIHLSRTQLIRNGVFLEELHCRNYGNATCQFDLSLAFGADFKDIFEIRGMRRQVKSPPVKSQEGDHRLSFQYTGLDNIGRQTIVVVTSAVDFDISGQAVHFSLTLDPEQEVSINYTIYFNIGVDSKQDIDPRMAKEAASRELGETRRLFASVYTSNSQFNHWINRSMADILALLAPTKSGLYPYAGVPWYNTAFGRDGIVTAMELLWLAPAIAKDVLLFLASRQATAFIPEKDAEPGKIMHETRGGEMANTGEVPFGEYYGTIDATPLFVMLAGMYYQRTGDRDTIDALWPHITAAISWIDNYGDLDGDGWVEYRHKAKSGLTNQGWKDSFDSIMHENGELAEPPIALCEVQGYVYAAKKYAAGLAAMRNEAAFSGRLREQAALLKKKFNEQFWDEQLNCFVLALDGSKQPCRVTTSNAGHCLFTEIATEPHARKLASSLLGSDMFTGWGIRTLSAATKRYNPMSYHNGSIWPHDNALIAHGLSLYGFKEYALKIMQGLFDASLFIDLQRLPELFCGFDRRRGEGPTAYPVACSPQAWSVAAVFMLLQACFRININAPDKTIIFEQPVLPGYLEQVSIHNLSLGENVCNFVLTRLDSDVGFNLLQKPSDWSLIITK